MPKLTVYASQRVREFPADHFKVENGKLFCSLCSEFIKYEKKSTVQLHVNSSKHKISKAALNGGEAGSSGSSLASTIPQVMQHMVSYQEKIKNMVSMFTSVGIPLHVFRNEQFKQWIQTSTNITTAPSESTLRKYLSNCADDDLNLSKHKFETNDIYVVIDESIDIKNRKVVNVLVGSLGKPTENPRLVKTKIVQRCTADIIVDIVLDAANDIGVHRSQIVVLISDNAPYMKAAGMRLAAVATRLLHSTCWAHVLHLCAEEIRNSLNVADSFISAVKSALTKTPARRERLLNHLWEGEKISSLPPVPVITRWGTWLQAGKYHNTNYNTLKRWIELENEEGSAAVTNIKKLIESDEECLKSQLNTIAKVADAICKQTKVLESHIIDSSQVWLILSSVREILHTSGVQCKKLAKYMSGHHVAANFWKQVQCLDPTQANSNMFASGLPTELKRFSEVDVPLQELCMYRAILQEEVTSISTFSFWKKQLDKMPILSNLAMKAITVPPSSASVERSFSTLRWILNPRRSSFTEENLDAHLRLAFNQEASSNISGEEEED